MTMRKPTKKDFYFPKSADGHQAEGDKLEEGRGTATAGNHPGSKKAAKQMRVPAVEAAPVVEVKAKRARKDKAVRDSFTMPKSDYEKIAALRQKCLDAGVSVKKSELLRAGLRLLESAPSKRLLAAISAVETLNTGRPAKS
jgi:hypothetical protein